jgi:tetratricopeptide (TPR) repeat protein
MPTRLMRALRRIALPAVCTLALTMPAAVLPGAAGASTEAERDAVFARLLRAPDDRALMLQYARLSVALREYEAAVSTLERMLRLAPDDAETRFELGIAYFALGSAELAAHHFAVLGDGAALPPDQAAELRAYKAQNEAAQRISRITGRVSAGVATEDGVRGNTATVALNWRIDMGTAAPAFWLTDVLGTVLRYSQGSSGNARGFVLRTGPMFSLDGTAYGPHLRPYAELRSERDLVGEDRRGIAVGLQLRNTHSAQWSSFADLRHGRLEAADLDIDLDETELSFGGTWRPSRDTLLRLSARIRDESGSSAGSRRWTGLRLDAVQEFRPGALAVPRNWTVSAYLQTDRIKWRDGVNLTEHRDSAGIALRAFVTRSVFVDASARNMRWRSDLALREGSRTLGALQIGMEF